MEANTSRTYTVVHHIVIVLRTNVLYVIDHLMGHEVVVLLKKQGESVHPIEMEVD